MRKLLLYTCILTMGVTLQAKDKEPKPDAQPTLEERFELLTLQRDALVKEINKMRAEKEAEDTSNAVGAKATEIGKTYGCVGWKPDFTCTKEDKTAKK